MTSLRSAIALTVTLLAASAAAEPPPPVLPAPSASFANFSSSVPWPAGRLPTSSPGFVVSLYAGGLDSPRWSYQLPNGDVLVAEANSGYPDFGRITLLRDADRDGRVDGRFVFLANETGNLNQPFGMALVGTSLYVANTDGLWRYPYATGVTRIAANQGRKVLDLPADGYNNHWTRNVVASPDKLRLFITVGSATNVDEGGQDSQDPRRASIIEYTIATGASRPFATGLRNPNGMDFEPVTGALWTVVNERDGLGDDLVPDFLTRVARGGFYGWPWRYFGTYDDTRANPTRPATLPRAIVPELAVGAHTATLGLTFYRGTAFPPIYRGGAFIGQRGSWNRSKQSGYRVAFVPFDANGNVAGAPRTFLGGFVADAARSQVYGRPVDVTALADGSLIVNDDFGNCIWRVAFKGPETTTPQIGGLFLMNADTDMPIGPIENGGTIDLKRIGTSRISVVAAPGGAVRSVRFLVDGVTQRIETGKPYAIAGDDGTASARDDYFPWTPTVGVRRIEAVPYSGPDGTGRAGAKLSILVRVTNG